MPFFSSDRNINRPLPSDSTILAHPSLGSLYVGEGFSSRKRAHESASFLQNKFSKPNSHPLHSPFAQYDATRTGLGEIINPIGLSGRGTSFLTSNDHQQVSSSTHTIRPLKFPVDSPLFKSSDGDVLFVERDPSTFFMHTNDRLSNLYNFHAFEEQCKVGHADAVQKIKDRLGLRFKMIGSEIKASDPFLTERIHDAMEQRFIEREAPLFDEVDKPSISAIYSASDTIATLIDGLGLETKDDPLLNLYLGTIKKYQNKLEQAEDTIRTALDIFDEIARSVRSASYLDEHLLHSRWNLLGIQNGSDYADYTPINDNRLMREGSAGDVRHVSCAFKGSADMTNHWEHNFLPFDRVAFTLHKNHNPNSEISKAFIRPVCRSVLSLDDLWGESHWHLGLVEQARNEFVDHNGVRHKNRIISRYGGQAIKPRIGIIIGS